MGCQALVFRFHRDRARKQDVVFHCFGMYAQQGSSASGSPLTAKARAAPRVMACMVGTRIQRITEYLIFPHPAPKRSAPVVKCRGATRGMTAERGSTNSPDEQKVYQFILDEIESVPHLEALLLLWNSRPQPWTIDNLARRLYVSGDFVRSLLDDLIRRQFVEIEAGAQVGYRYGSGSVERDQLIAALDATYRREVVRVSTTIHTKASSSVRDFARAFRFTKGSD